MPTYERQQDSWGAEENKKIKAVGSTHYELVNLPTEILGLILEETLSLSDFLDTGTFEDVTISDILGHDILATCKSIRSQGLEMILNRCVWIRIGCSMFDAWEVLRKHVLHAAVTPGWRQILDEEKLPTIDLFIGLSDDKSADSRCITSPRQSVLIAFSYHIWLGFLAQLQLHFRGLGIMSVPFNHLALRCVESNSSIERVLESHILPVFMNMCSLYEVGFFGKRLHNSSNVQSVASLMATMGSSARIMLHNYANTLAKRILTWYADGQKGDGDVTTLYGGVTFDIFADFSSDNAGLNLEGGYWTGIGVGKLIINVSKLGSKVVSVLNKLFKSKDVAWFRRNESIEECARRWIFALRGIMYFLRHDRRGQLHRDVGELYEVVAKIAAGLCYGDDDDDVLGNDDYYDRDIANSENYREVAVRLLEDPTFELQSRLNSEQNPKYERPHHFAFHNLQGSGFCFDMAVRGDLMTFEHSLTLMDWLRALANDEDVGGVDEEVELRYCGESCNCIMY